MKVHEICEYGAWNSLISIPLSANPSNSCNGWRIIWLFLIILWDWLLKGYCCFLHTLREKWSFLRLVFSPMRSKKNGSVNLRIHSVYWNMSIKKIFVFGPLALSVSFQKHVQMCQSRHRCIQNPCQTSKMELYVKMSTVF